MATKTEHNIVLSQKEFKVVGQRPVRHDGVDKVTGRARYGADIHLSGMLHGKVFRSPHAHARIRSIDTSKAEKLPGVLAVVTARDLAPVDDSLFELYAAYWVSFRYLSNNVLADGKVLYKGHGVAAVAATSPHAAEEALSLIKVDYEVLPHVTDVEEAMKPGAPVLHDRIIAANPRDRSLEGTNIALHHKVRLGDVDKGFAKADAVVEREYRTKTVHQGYIEPQNATAWWAPDDILTIWCSNQGHFGVRHETAKLVGLPESRVKVVPMEIGGGFGGKITCHLEPIAAVLSRKAGRPVKMTMSRAEVLQATGPTCGGVVRVKIGATKDGRITAAKAYLAFDAGAYPGSYVDNAANCMFAPYDIENMWIDGYDVLDNKPKTGAYRAPGTPNGALGTETVVEELCRKLGMDRLDFRLKNAAREGTRKADGTRNPRIGFIETLEAIRSHAHYRAPLAGSGPNRGRGVSFGYSGNVSGAAVVVASLVFDGRIALSLGSVDIGGTRTGLAQQFAEVLGIPVEEVNPQVADTDTIGFTDVSSGSSSAFKSGWAAYEAGQDMKRLLIARAAHIWGVPENQVEFAGGAAKHKTDPELRLTLKELGASMNETGGPIVARAAMNPGGWGGSYSANIVDVQVDPETGKVDILRYTVFQDAGKAIHPSYVEGQMQGGTVQGIGWALFEEYVFNDKGEMLNPSLLDYRTPTPLDVPMIDTVIIEVANPGHPYGVRGVGESSIVPPLPAISNAIYDAIGVRVAEVPMSPGNVVKAIKGQRRS
ncbi:MAG: xanthine dehydrogenase family protein molybdopterin-binding subunit [SAR202 cluster bacterium]|nr:xanthine dehydrogenase family protein molybdopterin-binding subunit [SAR202 cluster bacterium]